MPSGANWFNDLEAARNPLCRAFFGASLSLWLLFSVCGRDGRLQTSGTIGCFLLIACRFIGSTRYITTISGSTCFSSVFELSSGLFYDHVPGGLGGGHRHRLPRAST